MAYRLVTLGMMSTALAGTVPHNLKKRDTFSWGSIGDSWTSGVAYSDDNALDSNKDGCMRTKDAWSVQLANDNTWAENPQDWIFNGCSGSTLGDMHGYGNGGRQLINAITNNPQVIFMSAGGNNAFFGEIVGNCIYQAAPFHKYGNHYERDPDCSGDCCKSLQKADNYINQQGDGGFYQDVLNTINDLMGTPVANGRDQFFLYINGYVQFFNEDTSGSDSCDAWTFCPWESRADVVTVHQVLRKRMNSLVRNLNQVYQNAINAWQPDFTRQTEQHVVYVDVDPFFNHHRFCEPGDTLNDQWSGSNVWNWNLQFSNNQDPFVASEVDVPVDPDLNLFSGSGSTGDGPSGGWKSRPFHPKERGHMAVKDAIIAKMRASGMPGVKPAPPYVPGQCGFHLREKWSKKPSRTDGPAYITISKLVDGAGNIIGQLETTEIDNVESVGMTSQLPYVVVITPWDSGEDWDSWNYYNLKFAYAGTEWTTFDDQGVAHCSVGGRDSPESGIMTQDMDCVFPC